MATGVLAPYFLKNLVTDLGDQKYSLLLNESTDISVSKHLGVVIGYFSEKQGTILLTFFGLTELESANARGLATALVNMLEKSGIRLHNLLGIGTDNASVMAGINNGLYKILKEEYGLPNLVLVCCVCHSLQLAIPRSIEFLIRETYNANLTTEEEKVIRKRCRDINAAMSKELQ